MRSTCDRTSFMAAKPAGSRPVGNRKEFAPGIGTRSVFKTARRWSDLNSPKLVFIAPLEVSSLQ